MDGFGLKLKALRTEAGLTQQQLADAAKMTRDGIAHLEQGRREPSWATVQALAAALGVDCTAFTAKPEDAKKPARGRPKR